MTPLLVLLFALILVQAPLAADGGPDSAAEAAMKVIGHLGRFDRLFGVPATTRNWNTITAIAGLLGTGGS